VTSPWLTKVAWARVALRWSHDRMASRALFSPQFASADVGQRVGSSAVAGGSEVLVVIVFAPLAPAGAAAAPHAIVRTTTSPWLAKVALHLFNHRIVEARCRLRLSTRGPPRSPDELRGDLRLTLFNQANGRRAGQAPHGASQSRTLLTRCLTPSPFGCDSPFNRGHRRGWPRWSRPCGAPVSAIRVRRNLGQPR